MLDDETIYKGVTTGYNMGPSRRGGASDAAREERRRWFNATGLALAGQGYGNGPAPPATILEYAHPCHYMWSGQDHCEGNGIADVRMFDFGISQQDPDIRQEKIMKRFKEYIISGQCQVCQHKTLQACIRREAAMEAAMDVEDSDED